MKQVLRIQMLFAVLLLVSTGLFAQTTATLTGTVTSDGAGLPGTTVTISSPSMQGTRTTTTGDGGGYSFNALPPGDYTVRVELQGMQTATRRVQVGVSQAGRVDIDLKVSAVAEAITVTAAAPSVLETPTVSQNLSAKLIEDLPIARTVLAAAELAPGVSNNTFSAGQLQISGGPGYDNLVMINGVAITETVRRQALSLFIEDAIQETTVLTGAISAEYGGFTGGVVNSITKSGGNQFSGSVRDSLSNPSWQERTPRQETANTKLTEVLNQVWEATIGGFILRDRLWFFGAGRDTSTTRQIALRAVPLGDATRSGIEFASATEEQRYEVKLTGQVTAKHNLSGSFFNRESTTQNDVFTLTSYDLNQQSNRSDPQELMSLFYNGVLTNNWMLEGRYSAMEWGVGHGGGSQFTDFVRGTIVRNRADGNARWNSATFCGVCDKETRSNDGWNIKSNYFLSTSSLGNHNFVAGVEDFSEHRFANNFQSGSNVRFFVNSAQRQNGTIYPTVTPGRAPTAAYLVWTPIFISQQNESDLGSRGFFFNDRWDLNEHWNFSLGVRYDKNDAVDSSGNVAADDSRITPRLNATFDPAGDGRHRFTASYGQYASRIVEGPGTGGASAGNPGYIYYSYLGPAINPAGTPVDQLIDTRAALTIVENWLKSTCNAQGKCGLDNLDLLRPNSGHSVPGYDTRIDGSLNSPYVEEMTIGYGSQILSNLVARVDVVSRNWKDFYGFRADTSTPRLTDPLGIGHDVQIVENTNDVSREYRGVQFQTNWRPRRFNVGLNYTYATLKGNDDQESAVSGTVGNSIPTAFYPEVSAYANFKPEGYLSQDQRHRGRMWIGYDIPLPLVIGALNVSVLQNYDSGLPYSITGNVLLPASVFTDRTAGTNYITAPNSRPYYYSKRGEFRLDDISATNLALNYRFPISRFEFFAQGEMLNVFSNETVNSIVTTIATSATSTAFAPFNPFTDTPKECPQFQADGVTGTTNATCTAMGANYRKAANFGTPANNTAFQTPRTWRFSAGLRF